MWSMDNNGREPQTAGGQFKTTRWSQVRRLRGSDPAAAAQALSQLCQDYWYPLYAFIRRQGHPPPDAQDLTQEFFARLLEKHALGKADPARGKFRSFLLTALRHFLVNEWDRAQAQKRGGGAQLISLDTRFAETRYALLLMDKATPEMLFEREWALTLLGQVLARLRAEQEKGGKLDQFNLLRGCLMGERGLPYAELAAQLDKTEDAVRMAASRLRRRYRELLEEEVAQTVAGPEEIKEEIQHLLEVLGNG
jgi:RNA polymerase sigma factor (sigma-70 family)